MSNRIIFKKTRRCLLTLLAVVMIVAQDASAQNAGEQDELDKVLDYLIEQKLNAVSAEVDEPKTQQRARLGRLAVDISIDTKKLRPLEPLSAKFPSETTFKKKVK